MTYSLNALYQSIGISKQGFHQRMDRYLKGKDLEGQIIQMVYRIREEHPTMGIRDIYYKLKPEGIGRDRFEKLCMEWHLSVERRKNFRKTTDSSGVIRFENLLVDLKIERPNQVWQSDITYYEVEGRFYYLTFIIDACSRLIVGYAVSEHLITEQTTIPALKKAIQLRIKLNMSIYMLILHSDGGGQYYDKNFLALTKRHHIRNSMCEYPWENGKAERINGVIKNNYLIHKEIKTFKELKKEVDRSVYLYNTEKPHIKLGRKSPKEFEKEYFCKIE
jgi:transposase InsO family protein